MPPRVLDSRPKLRGGNNRSIVFRDHVMRESGLLGSRMAALEGYTGHRVED